MKWIAEMSPKERAGLIRELEVTDRTLRAGVLNVKQMIARLARDLESKERRLRDVQASIDALRNG